MNIQYSAEEFFELFRPVPNLSKTSVGPTFYNEDDNTETQYGYETYGVDLEYVQSVPKENVWTVIEEDGVLYTVSGFRVVNRLAYMITEKSWKAKGDFIVAEY